MKAQRKIRNPRSFQLSGIASQVNPVFSTFLASPPPPAIFHPNLFGAYRHVGQECCDWFSEVGTRAGQPTKPSRPEGASGHTHRGHLLLWQPVQPVLLHYSTLPLSFVSSISVRGPFHSDQASRTNLSGGIGPHTSGIMPLPLVLLSFVSPISVGRQISRDKLCARRGQADKAWGASHGQFGQYEATHTNMRPHTRRGHHKTASACSRTLHGVMCHTDRSLDSSLLVVRAICGHTDTRQHHALTRCESHHI